MLQYSTTFFVCALLAFASAQDQRNGDVRLITYDERHSDGRGRLEVFDGMLQDWTAVCFDKEESQEGVAQAVCRQLGYYDLKEVGTVVDLDLPNDTSTNQKLTFSGCSKNSNPQNAIQHIFRCEKANGDCPNEEDMAILCDGKVRGSSPYDTMVDFEDDLPMGRPSPSEGFAKVYINEEWGPVCGMMQGDADAFCRQLSYTNAESVELMNETLPESPVLDDFKCSDSSDSSCLRSCFNYPSSSREINCPQGYSYVICTFQEDDDSVSNEYGTESRCTPSSGSTNTAKIAGAVVGSVLGVAAIATVILLLCLCVPGCRGKKGNYSPVEGATSSKTKYDAI